MKCFHYTYRTIQYIKAKTKTKIKVMQETDTEHCMYLRIRVYNMHKMIVDFPNK